MTQPALFQRIAGIVTGYFTLPYINGAECASTGAQIDAAVAGTTGGNATQVNSVATASTGAEVDVQCDVSVNTETIAKTTTVSVTKRMTKIDSTTGTGAITLAAPGAAMFGMIKVIEMTVDGGDITLALTNVTGGSAATTCTFSAINQALVLVGGTNKWHVIAESGAALT
jgi:hypothetical protein